MTARRLLATFAMLLALGAVTTLWSRRAGSVADGTPSVGSLSPHRPELAGRWEEVARIPASALGRGAIVDLDERGDTLYVLQIDHWMRIVRGEPSESFGSRVTGSPTWLAGGGGIRAVPGGVLILDRVRQVVGEWNADGTRRAERDFRSSGPGFTSSVEAIASDTTGTLLVSARLTRDDFAGQWLLLRGRLGDTRFDTVYRGDTAQESDSHDMPRAAPAGGGAFVVVPSLGWKLLTIDAAGRVGDERVRADGPRWPVPDTIRQRYARLLDRFPPAQRRAYALPPTLPAIRGITTTADGRIVVLVATDADATHAEVLTGRGEALGRLWPAPETRATFVANGSVFRVEDDEGFTRIERQRILPPED